MLSFQRLNQSFVRLKIKLKEEIVTIGDKTINPVNISGKYIDPKDWNELIDDDEYYFN